MNPVELRNVDSLTEAIQSVRDAGGWKIVMARLNQTPGRLASEAIGAIMYLPDGPPTVFEFWLVGFIAGLTAAQHPETDIRVKG